MDDLIKELERTTRPDRAVDNAIAYAVNAYIPDDLAGWPPRYTSSIDEALTLVPEGARVREIGQWDEHGQPSGWFANVTRWMQVDGAWENREFTYGIQDPMDFHPKVPPLAPNGAIALCIAALKARQAAAVSKVSNLMARQDRVKYVGAVLDEDARDWIAITGEQGYSRIVVIAVQMSRGSAEVYLAPADARDLARHLSAAAEAVEVGTEPVTPPDRGQAK